MLKSLAIIVLLDSLGLNPGFIMTPLARLDSTTLLWDRYAQPLKAKRFILYSSPDSVTFTAIDSLPGGRNTRAKVYLAPHPQWLYITAWDSTAESGPSNVVYLPGPPSFIRRFQKTKTHSSLGTRAMLLNFGAISP